MQDSIVGMVPCLSQGPLFSQQKVKFSPIYAIMTGFRDLKYHFWSLHSLQQLCAVQVG